MRSISLLISFLLAFIPSNAFAEKKRPTIALVLEGGGALGFAHVGVLKVLREERIPVDYAVGTSMGSIVGAAFASGRTIEDIEAVIMETDWDKLFNENIPRELVHYRMKSGRDGELYGDTKLGFLNGDVVMPTAMVEGQLIEPVLQKVFSHVPSTCSFDDLPVPYRAVAADIETGETVVLSGGSLSLAARASMSVPGFFSPVEINGRLLVDGGVTNNFPTDVALNDFKPDYIIGVEFGFEPRKRDALNNPLAISGQILDFLVERASVEGRKLMRPQDVMLHPDVRGFGATSFKNAKELIKAGEDIARAEVKNLQKFKISEKEYEEYERKRTSNPEYAPVIDYVRIAEGPPNKEASIYQSLNIKLGQPFNREEVSKQVEAIHQTGIYKKITADIEEKDGKHGVVIRAQEKEWLKNYLRVGVALEDNFEGQSNYALALNGRMRDINSAGAYWDNQFEIGRNPRFFSEFYQPVAQGSRFFVAPDVTLQKQQLFIRRDGDTVAEYERQTAVGGLKGGISFNRFGELVGGWRRGPGRFERQIGGEELPEFSYDIGEYFSRFVIDQLDNPDFPTKGYRLIFDGLASRDSAGGQGDFEQGRAFASLPLTFGTNTILLNAEGGSSSEDTPAERSYSLGGFMDVSGFIKNSLVADNFWVARTAFYHQFAQGTSSLINFGGFYGGSVEYSNLQSRIEEIGDSSGIISGSVFLGLDTPLLPLYIGYGLSNQSEQSAYLAIGRIGSRRR